MLCYKKMDETLFLWIIFGFLVSLFIFIITKINKTSVESGFNKK
jgi:uncharacterized integral membrane protein